LENKDIKEINDILKETRTYFNKLVSEIGNNTISISESDFDMHKIDIVGRCIRFLDSDKNFRLNTELNREFANINDLDYYMDSIWNFILSIESNEWNYGYVILENVSRLITLVINYLDDLIGPVNMPKHAEASLPTPPTPPKKAAAAQEMPPFESDEKKSGYKPFEPHKPGTGGKTELY